MNQLIKAARVFAAHLPSAEAMREHLPHEAFNEPLSTELSTCGFVPMEQGTFVTEFPGGYAFRFRLAQKVIPGSVVKQAVADECTRIEIDTGRKPGKKEKREIKETIIADLAAQAFVRTTDVICYFRTATNQLLVPALSKTIGDKLMTKLVMAVESVKTETIHVSNVTQGLTARLKKWLDGDRDAFGNLWPANEIDLEQEARKVKVKMSYLQSAHLALTSSLDQGFGVSAIGLGWGEHEFKLTHDFKVQGIWLSNYDGDFEEVTAFEARAAAEVDLIGQIVDQLVEMFQYDEEPKDVPVP